MNTENNFYLIAEIGHNHQGNMKKAIELFKAAKESGAHAVKLQKRENSKLYTKNFLIKFMITEIVMEKPMESIERH